MEQQQQQQSGLVIKPKDKVTEMAYIKSMTQYHEMYEKSIETPDEFWSRIANQFHWETSPVLPSTIFRYNFDITKGPIFTKWFDGATTNISYNLLDRNIQNGCADKIAFYW